MPKNEYIELYDNLKVDMRFFVSSDVRSKIMISLKDGPKDLAALRRDLGFNSSTILHGMYQLDDKNLIFRKSGIYSLSQTGELVILKMINVMESLYSLLELENLFLNHDIQSIPPHLLHRLECLKKSQVVESDSKDLMKPYNTVNNLISNSKEINLLSSIYYPFYKDILLNSGSKHDIKLIVTPRVLDTIFSVHGEIKDDFNTNNILLWELEEDIRLSLTLTDKFMAMGLFSSDGVYDSNRFLVADDHHALKWGSDLLKYYLDKATPFKL
ncbi:winged helix-turn-helix domain-containing protein [Methanobacterium movens]